jgi:hypothetical protein
VWHWSIIQAENRARYWPNIINATQKEQKTSQAANDSKLVLEHLAVASLLQHGQWSPAAVKG